jgi:large subunit ribosomal protein L5
MPKQPIKFKENFEKNIAAVLQKEIGLKNKLALPRLSKITINVGLGSFLAGKKDYSQVLETLAAISGQKPVVTKARKAISNFKIKENQPIGVTVTIRGKRMYDFFNKFVNITLPRIRDFRGLSPKAFDTCGNYSVGIKESTVFPEVNQENLEKIHGLEITIVTTARNNEQGYKLLKALGFPFQKKEKEKGKEKEKESKSSITNS